MTQIFRIGLFFLTFFYLSENLKGQEILPKVVDLGKIKKRNQDVVDLIIYNPDTVGIYLLNYKAEQPMYFEARRNYIPPNRSEIFRVKVNPQQLGTFEKSLTLYFCHQENPLELLLTGNVKTLSTYGLQKCPSFGDLPSSQQLAKERRKEEGNIQKKFISIPPLTPIENTLEKEKVTEDDLLPLLGNEFQANNIIFLIDASSSMEKEGKFELLKSSLLELLKPLRDIDYLSIITYAGEAKVLLPPTSSIEKDSIAKSINGLKAMGSTNAIDGIDLAIETGEAHFIADGNNEIYLVTDGAFSLGKRNERSRQKLKDAADKGLTTSVIAIKSQRWTYSSLKEITSLGQGKIIKIKKEKDQSRILKSVKTKSRE